jgi:SM-20-related protein
MLTFLKPPNGLCVQYNVLPQNIRNNILDEIIAAERHFQPATVSTNMSSARRARVLYATNEVKSAQCVVDLVQELIPAAHKAFGRLDEPPATRELQITGHGHGDYFNQHNDNGAPDCANREISFVYYVHTGAFIGGELQIFNMNEDGVVGSSIFDIKPVDNSLVVFTSSMFHAVRTVFLKDNPWMHHRFTVNGWVRR